MATDLKGTTIASSYQDLVKRDSGTYSQTGMNIELQNDSGTALATGLYLESGATTDNVGIGIAAPSSLLHVQGSSPTIRIDSSSGTASLFIDGNSNSDVAQINFGYGGSTFGEIEYANAASASNAEMRFKTGGDNLRMIILGDGKVGIGTDEPSEQLEISTQGGHANFSLKRTESDNAIDDNHVLGRISFKGVDAALDVGAYIQAVAAGDWIGNDEQGADIEFHVQSDASADALGTAAMIIADNGRVGIGCEAPLVGLHVQDESMSIVTQNAVASALHAFQFRRNKHTTEGQFTNLDINSLLGGFEWWGSANGAYRLGARMLAGAHEAWTTNQYGTYMSFETTTDATDAPVERMRIDHDGSIGIGTTDPTTAFIHINQSNASDGVTLLKLQQADVDESFIDFVGTSDTDQSKSISTDTSVGALTGHIKIEVNGSPFWLAYYAPN